MALREWGDMQLSKHHGLGNDFLVCLLDYEPEGLIGLTRLVCDRRRGVGADGLIIGVRTSQRDRFRMVLHNSDGSRAAMSGNGLRCLAHAVAMETAAGAVSLQIETDAGLRNVTVDGDGPDVTGSVDMGVVGLGPTIPAALVSELGSTRAGTGDVGNPHLVVCVEDPTTVDLAAVGASYESHFPDGMNVEFIAPAPGEPNAIDLRVWERGAGITEACGTGATASAALAAAWGLVGRDVTVHMAGGDVRVLVDERATLVGPSTYVATIQWSATWDAA